MDEQALFKKISLGPFSCASLPLVAAALQAIRRRYPNSNSQSLANSPDPSASPFVEHQASPEYMGIPTFCAEPAWVDFAQWARELPAEEGDDSITPSTLRLARNDHLDAESVASYLELLRVDSPCARIVDIRQLRHDCNEIGDAGVDVPTIVPFQDGDGWAFAVAYSDCIHWYDSRPDASVPIFLTSDDRPVVDDWTGPKQPNLADSGILMLLGIRQIQHGVPHLDQLAANHSGSGFRARVLIELLCGRLNPTESDFENLVARVRQDPEQSLFFDDATYGMDFETGNEVGSPTAMDAVNGVIITPPDSTQNPSPQGAQPCPPESGASTNTPRLASGRSLPVAPQRPVQHASPHGHESGGNVARTEGNSPSFQWRHVVQPHPFEDRQVILGHLSQAVKASRSAGASMQTGLPVLWSLVLDDNVSSTFHQRYNAVLFHDKMQQLHDSNAVEQAWGHNGLTDRPVVDEMRLMQSSCRFWRELCDLRSEWGDGKYTMLLVGSKSVINKMSRVQKDAFIAAIRMRLSDVSDPLSGCLDKARDLCCAIVNKSLPEDTLMIDRYLLRQYDVSSDALYGAFTSLDPRIKVPIPRQASRRTQR
ncbi:hypothetical protein HJFPF1_12327 [Paramyrothecium foliicola]|nr:hypothetical protein HJFPF1_12327 [Paramyrothecium foliicola]